MKQLDTGTLDSSNIEAVVATLKRQAPFEGVPEGFIVPNMPRVSISGWWWKKYFIKHQLARRNLQIMVDREYLDIMNEVLKNYSK